MMSFLPKRQDCHNWNQESRMTQTSQEMVKLWKKQMYKMKRMLEQWKEVLVVIKMKNLRKHLEVERKTKSWSTIVDLP